MIAMALDKGFVVDFVRVYHRPIWHWDLDELACFSGFHPLAEALICWSDFIDDRYDNSSPSRSALCRMNCRIYCS